MPKIKVGDEAPEFGLRAHSGEAVTLSQFRGKKNVVLFFYPKDNTPICTAEACAFRDSHEVFHEAGAEVLGVSSDSSDSHKAFATRYQLPFLLLSDEGGRLRGLYGVPSTLGLLPGRVTFVIDKRGIVRHVFSAQFSASRHIDEALAVLKRLD